MSELVSIVIPTFNRQDFIADAILSAINQTYQNIEIIVSDNCSFDNTISIVKKFAVLDKRIKYFVNNENIGPVYNWQKCLNNAQGKFIKILWSDDLISNTFIEESIKIFDDQTAFVLSGYKIYDIENKKDIFFSKFQTKSYTTLEYLRHSIIYTCYDFPLSPGCAIFRSSDLKNAFVIDIDNIDGLDSKKNGAGNDLLMMLNIAAIKKYSKISCLNSYGAIFRAHDKSFSISDTLDLYYEYARLYFIKRHLIVYKKEYQLYKSRLSYLNIRKSNFAKIFSLVNYTNCYFKPPFYLFLINKTLYKIKFSLIKYI